MLKWAVTPRLNGDFYEHDGNLNADGCELLALEAILSQRRLPCLVRLVHDDFHEANDNYCLLLRETSDPYLLVSNETDRFSIPISFDGKSIVLFSFGTFSHLSEISFDPELIDTNPLLNLDSLIHQ
jgi:hypothetical protein